MSPSEIDAAVSRHAGQKTLYDRPQIDRSKARVAGPFTIEAVPAPSVKASRRHPGRPTIGGGQFGNAHGRNLAPGVIGGTNSSKQEFVARPRQRVSFTRLEPLSGTRWLHANGEKRPDHASVQIVCGNQESSSES